MNDPKPVLLIRVGDLPALGEFNDLASAIKGSLEFGEGDYLAVRVLRPISVAKPEAPSLRVKVGDGFIKRKPRASQVED